MGHGAKRWSLWNFLAPHSTLLLATESTGAMCGCVPCIQPYYLLVGRNVVSSGRERREREWMYTLLVTPDREHHPVTKRTKRSSTGPPTTSITFVVPIGCSSKCHRLADKSILKLVQHRRRPQATCTPAADWAATGPSSSSRRTGGCPSGRATRVDGPARAAQKPRITRARSSRRPSRRGRGSRERRG
jgi:hypothetical protein